MSLDTIERRLAEGTAAWLLFEFHCKRGDLFSEKQLATPVGQILAGQYPGRVKAEITHPHLIPIKQRGRPPQLDFVVLDGSNWEVAIETKWITNTPLTLGQIIWDLIRLELLVKHKVCDAYFIIGGFNKKLKEVLGETHLFDSTLKGNQYITHLKGQNIKLDLAKLNLATKEYINTKLNKYPAMTIPKILYLKKPQMAPKDSINLTFKIIACKILSPKNVERIKKI
jgi:hypothetical protein